MIMSIFLKNWSTETYVVAIREYGMKGREAL